jgi:hypothetical protein
MSDCFEMSYRDIDSVFRDARPEEVMVDELQEVNMDVGLRRWTDRMVPAHEHAHILVHVRDHLHPSNPQEGQEEIASPVTSVL